MRRNSGPQPSGARRDRLSAARSSASQRGSPRGARRAAGQERALPWWAWPRAAVRGTDWWSRMRSS